MITLAEIKDKPMHYNVKQLRIFMTVVNCKTFTQAAEVMGLEQPSVSRQMKLLQEALGEALIQTTPFGYSLTPEGMRLKELASQVLTQMEALALEVKAVKNNPEGELKVVVENFGQALVDEYLQEFAEQYPNIIINIRTEEFRSLLYSGQLSGAFVGITTLPKPKDSAHIWKEMGSIEFVPYAHPSYLERYGHPHTLSDLDHHRLIRYEWNNSFSYYNNDELNNPLLYQGRKDRKPRKHFVITDDVHHCKLMLNKGIGIGTIPRYQAHNTSLVRLLENEFDVNQCIETKVHLVYPPYGANNKVIKNFIDFILKKTKPSQKNIWLQGS